MKYIVILLLTAITNTVAQEQYLFNTLNDARVYIISPVEGQVVTEIVTVKFGLEGMGIAPAGVNREGTGHHHLIVDGSIPILDKPMGSEVIHFGNGQTQVQLKLSKGKHTLQLILGDFKHTPHEKPLISELIKIYVK